MQPDMSCRTSSLLPSEGGVGRLLEWRYRRSWLGKSNARQLSHRRAGRLGKGRLSSTPHHDTARPTRNPSVQGSVPSEEASVGLSNTPGTVTGKEPCQSNPSLRTHRRLVSSEETYLSNTRSSDGANDIPPPRQDADTGRKSTRG
jgi:hypothetical protein